MRNKTADQLAKEGREKESPRHICLAEKPKLLSVIKESHFLQQDWRIQPKPERTSPAATTPTDHNLPPQNRPPQTDLTYLLTYAHRSQWSIGHQRPPAIALCSGLLLSFRTSWSPAVSALLQCLASNCCEAGLSSSSLEGSRSGLGVWCWMLAF